MQRHSDRDEFYKLIDELEIRNGGRRRLEDCHGRQDWPTRGVYFFFEPGELRSSPPEAPRVVRIGTHALVSKSRSTLWNRVRQHKGTTRSPGGNHRGSIFRLLTGEALSTRDPSLAVGTWGQGSTASREVRRAEKEHEGRVSEYLGAMTLLVLEVPDQPAADSDRGVLERNSIALLSNAVEPVSDAPSEDWLGRFSGREKVRVSGLWNNRHVDEPYCPGFLKLFHSMIERMKRFD